MTNKSKFFKVRISTKLLETILTDGTEKTRIIKDQLPDDRELCYVDFKPIGQTPPDIIELGFFNDEINGTITPVFERIETIDKSKVEDFATAAKMLWVTLANVSGGDWTKQSTEWQEAANKWRDNYYQKLKELGLEQ